MSISNPPREWVDVVVTGVEAATIKRQFDPQGYDFKHWTGEVRGHTLGRLERANGFQNLVNDLDFLVGKFPIREGPDSEIKVLFHELKASEIYVAKIWDEFYRKIYDYLLKQTSEEHASAEENDFWNVCFAKFKTIAERYHLNLNL